jgi:hypothetical protein
MTLITITLNNSCNHLGFRNQNRMCLNTKLHVRPVTLDNEHAQRLLQEEQEEQFHDQQP